MSFTRPATSCVVLLLLCCYSFSVGAVASSPSIFTQRHHPAAVASIPSHSNGIVRESPLSPPTSTLLQYNLLTSDPPCQMNGASIVAMNYTSGTCIKQDSATSYQYFCDQTGGYDVTYASSECDDTNDIIAIGKFDLGCTNGGTTYYVCENAQYAPQLPFVWPPADWIVKTECDGIYPTVECAADPVNNILCTHLAVPANQCMQGGGGSYQYFCTEDTEWVGVASYPSPNCAEAVASSVRLLSTSCNSTINSTQCTGSPLSLTSYPLAGTFYSDPGATSNSNATSTCSVTPYSEISYQQPDECIHSVILNCDHPGEVNMTVYNDQKCSPQEMYGEPEILTTNYCNPTGQGKIYFCNGQPFYANNTPPAAESIDSHISAE